MSKPDRIIGITSTDDITEFICKDKRHIRFVVQRRPVDNWWYFYMENITQSVFGPKLMSTNATRIEAEFAALWYIYHGEKMRSTS